MATVNTEFFFIPRETKSPAFRKTFDRFDEWFSRCHNTLHFTAHLILGRSAMAERAVRNCRFRASTSLWSFENEGQFHSWLLRLLISEALTILPQSRTKATEENVPSSQEVRLKLRTGEHDNDTNPECTAYSLEG